MPTPALRIVKLRAGGSLPDAIIDWVWSGEPVASVFETVREAVPSFGEADEADLMERVAELSRTVSNMTGLNLYAEAWDALGQEGPPPDLDSMYGGEEPSAIETVADVRGLRPLIQPG